MALNLRDPPNVPPYGWSYFDHLVAVYVNLNTSDPRADAVIQKSHQRPDDLTWGDIFLLENVNFYLMSENMVDRSAWILRERFREISSPTMYGRYASSGVPTETDTPAKLSLLKADLTRVLDVLHWYYSLIPMRERRRKSLTVKCIFMVVIYTVALLGFLVWCSRGNRSLLATLACVLYFGIIGGFVSSQRRMQSLPSDGDPLICVFGLDNAGYYLWLSPLLGAIFAVILTLMFIGGVLKGTVFPDFYNTTESKLEKAAGRAPPAPAQTEPTKPLPFFDFTKDTLPKGAEEYGKLFVWAFLAGFAERLVPDSLDRLSSKLDPATQSPAPNLSANPPAPRQELQQTGASTERKKTITEATLKDAMHTGESPAEETGK